MLKKTIKYTDFNDEEQVEDFYFNLTEAELAEMEVTKNSEYSNMLTNISNAKDPYEIVETFKIIIKKAYGVKSEDGKRFKKSKELSDEFESSAAFSELFMELLTDEGSAAVAFVAGIIPAKLKSSPEVITALKKAEEVTNNVQPVESVATVK